MRISSMREKLSGNKGTGKPWLLAAGFICACLLLPQAGSAAWSEGPIAVIVGAGEQCRPQVVFDDAGGYYVTWQDHEAEGVFAQHFDVNGDATWETDLQVGGGSIYHQQEAVADGSGGLLVAWSDDRDDYTYVQRIDVDGNLAWGEGGVAIFNDAEPWIASDGAGGAIVMSYNGLVNKVASDGSLPWTDADNPLEYSTSSSATKIVSDGAGGAILLWYESSLFSGIALQRIDADGNFVWNEGVPLQLSADGSSPDCPRLIPDNGGAIVAWYGWDVDHYEVMAQKVDADGQTQWTEGGQEIAAGTSTGYFEPASDSAGGAFITWIDWSTDTIYAQYIDADGDIVWDSPVRMSPEGDADDVSQHPRHTVEDGLGGFITAWCNGDEEAKAQRCDATGAVLWTTAGVVLATGTSINYEPKLASNGQGGVVAVWVDDQDETYKDIFMQGVSAEGVVGAPGYTPPTHSSSDNGPCFVDAVSAAAPGGAAGMLLLLIAGAGWLSLARRRQGL